MPTKPTIADIAPSRQRLTGWVLLILFATLGAWLLREIERTVGLRSGHLWDLLRNDPTFAFAMLDFFLTAAFAMLVLIERADLKSWRSWVALVVFCAVPTLGIILFLLIGKPRRGESPGIGSASELT